MIITDGIRQELVGKTLICRCDAPSLTKGKSYKVIKTEKYDSNQLKTLVTVLNDANKECAYDLMWFVNKQKDEILYDKTKYTINDTFAKLKHSPILNINLDDVDEDELKFYLKNSYPIISANDRIDYNEIPSLIKWLESVYSYCTDLKESMIKYVDFETARLHMESNSRNIAKYKNYEYYIKNNELYRVDDDGACALTLGAINSKEWILLE